jgi:predicted transcriptional regulator
MTKKRNKLEMISDILKILQNQKYVKITHLIYKANLSSQSIKPYIQDLLKNNLIEEIIVEERKFYKLAKKGQEFLSEYYKIKNIAESFGLQESL